MPISTGWLGRIVASVRAMFSNVAPAHEAAVVGMPSDAATDMAGDVMPAPVRAVAWMFAARMQIQARLNVPVGKTPRIARPVSAKATARRPKKIVEVKKQSTARSVHLQARHLAAKTRPTPLSNVVAMPSAARPARQAAKVATAKPYRLAA